MTTIWWYLIVGMMLVGMAALGIRGTRIPISTAIIYLGVGVIVGPYGLKLLSWDLIHEAALLEHITEAAVLISLFTVGLQLRRSLKDRDWWLPIRLASITMLLTIGMVTLIGVFFLDLPLGAAVLLGAILAPTDPVLASDVQVKDVRDRDAVRASLSGEAGLNDGTAFPFVMLGMGLLGLHPTEEAGLAGAWGAGPFQLLGWVWWDLIWAVAAGLLIGAGIGWGIGIQILRRREFQAMALSEQAFLTIGIIALTYGLTELVYGYGFLAVFAAGYALRYLELRATNHAEDPPELTPIAPDAGIEAQLEAVQTPAEAAHYVALSMSQFAAQLEHLTEAVVVVLVGAMLTPQYLTWDALWLAPLLLFIIRPIAVMLGLWQSNAGQLQQALTGWFGIRGIGSLYYLSYAITHALPSELSTRISALVLSIIAASIIAHGLSVTPLMSWYERQSEGRAEEQRA